MFGSKLLAVLSSFILVFWSFPCHAAEKEKVPEGPEVGKIYKAVPYYTGADAVPERLDAVQFIFITSVYQSCFPEVVSLVQGNFVFKSPKCRAENSKSDMIHTALSATK